MFNCFFKAYYKKVFKNPKTIEKNLFVKDETKLDNLGRLLKTSPLSTPT